MGFSAMSSFLPVNTGMAGVEPVDRGKDIPATGQRHGTTTIESQTQDQNVTGNGSGPEVGEGNRRPLDSILNPSQTQSYPNIPTTSATNTASREGSSTHSSTHDDAATAESDGEHHYHSDNEADMGNSAPPSKRKKGQRFFCTNYPPCNLSFTRSEHLARHIRKHTGERPFQCHCSRRFSRLDNLRQHAQTVHVNEDIPGDSLAATGTRFQRQIRTDRVRQPGRARAGTTGSGSQTAHSRAHSRNLSTSSVTSNLSSYGQSQELRRRPPPLMMANDGTARARMSLETMTSPPKTPPGQTHGYTGHSPGVPMYPAYPPAATGETASPYYASPASSTTPFWPDGMAARRLSVPSGQRPFDPPHSTTYPPPYSTRPPMPAPVRYHGNESSFASPTTGSHTPIDATGLSPSEAELRRRTWHPSTYSGFARPVREPWFQQPPNPTINSAIPPPSQGQTTRLPGIESFDQVHQRPLVPPPREPTPMAVDRAGEAGPPTSSSTATPAFGPSFSQHAPSQRPLPPFSGAGHRRGNLSIDTTLQRTLTKLDIHGNNNNQPKDATQWGQQTLGELQNIGSRPSTSSTYSQTSNRQEGTAGDQNLRTYETPAESSASMQPQNDREFGWYGNRTAASQPQNSTSLSPKHRENAESDGLAKTTEYRTEVTQGGTSSDGSQNSAAPSNTTDTPQNSTFAFTANSNSKPGFYSGSASKDSGMGRLEALVAVATSEDKDDFH